MKSKCISRISTALAVSVLQKTASWRAASLSDNLILLRQGSADSQGNGMTRSESYSGRQPGAQSVSLTGCLYRGKGPFFSECLPVTSWVLGLLFSLVVTTFLLLWKWVMYFCVLCWFLFVRKEREYGWKWTMNYMNYVNFTWAWVVVTLPRPWQPFWCCHSLHTEII